MIDFHTHILPGIDDGAKDVSVSAAMLEMEKKQGVNEIVLTPHYYGKFYSPTDFVRRRAAAYEKLLAVAAGEFFFKLGAEIHFSDTLSVNAECRKLAIGDTRYALVELPFGEKWSGSLFTRLRYFMDETELTGLGKIQYILGQRQISVQDTQYTDKVLMKVILPYDQEQCVVSEITEGTNGQAVIEKGDSCYFAEDGKEILVFEE